MHPHVSLPATTLPAAMLTPCHDLHTPPSLSTHLGAVDGIKALPISAPSAIHMVVGAMVSCQKHAHRLHGCKALRISIIAVVTTFSTTTGSTLIAVGAMVAVSSGEGWCHKAAYGAEAGMLAAHCVVVAAVWLEALQSGIVGVSRVNPSDAVGLWGSSKGSGSGTKDCRQEADGQA